MLLDTDSTRLRHMVEAAREAIGYLPGVRREDLERNRQLQHSLVRCIEIIGEAASRLTPELRQAHPDIPWQDIIGMRNRVIHAYFDIDLDLVWQTVSLELPTFIGRLEDLASRDSS